MPARPGFGNILRTLQHRNFRIYISGNAISLIGTWMQRIAVGWLTWELTESGFWLGVVACADFLPVVFVGPLAGVLADRFNRLHLMMLAQIIALLQAIALFALTAGGGMTVQLLTLLVFVHGVAIGFNHPARLAFMHSLVPAQQMTTAIAINSVVFNLARFIGPALAGLLIVVAGVEGAFAVNALSFLIFLLTLSLLRFEDASMVPEQQTHPSVLSQLAEGVSYAVRHPGIGPMLLLLLVASLGVRSFVDLMPGFAAEVFGGGAGALAMLSSAVGIGAVVSGLWIARRSSGGLTQVVLIGTLLQVLAILGFVASDHLWLGIASAVLAGMAMIAAAVGMQTLMQLSVDGALRGRVLSFYGVIFIGGPAAGALIMGGLSESLGLRVPFVAGAVLVLVVWLWIWWRRHRIAAALEPGPPQDLSRPLTDPSISGR